MRYYHLLYMSEELERKKDKVIRCVKRNKGIKDKFYVVLAQNDKNHLEILDSKLLQRICTEDVFVVGVLDTYEEALQCVQSLVQEVYEQTGDANVRQYLLCSQEAHDQKKE